MDIVPIFLFLIKTFGLLFFGFLLFKRFIDTKYLGTISKVFINFLIPAMVLNKFLLKFNLDLLKKYWTIPFISILFIVITIIIGLLCIKIFNIKFKDQFIAMITFTNCGYLVLPMILEFFKGEDQELALILNFMYTMFFMLLIWSLGVFLITGRKTKITIYSVPIPFVITIVAMLLGLLNVKQYIPKFAFDILNIIGIVGVYGIMIVLGGILSQIGKFNLSYIVKNYRFVLIKNFLIPALFIILIYLMQLSRIKSIVLSLVVITPPATNLAIITQRYPSDETAKQYIFSSIFASYITAIISIPLFLLLIEYLY